jgi:carotenoid 1,2-hydratase
MKIISDYTRDTASQKKNSGGYEWWYFDGISKDREYGFVIIFYKGNPFSRRYIQALSSENNNKYQQAKEYPALSISIYRKGKPVYYGFCEYEAENAFFDSEKIKGAAGKSEFNCSVRNGKLIYEIRLNQDLPSGDSVKGSLKFTSGIRDIILHNNNLHNNSSNHIWNLVQPQSEVEGEFNVGGYLPRTIRFTGQGYHDHNLGLEPMDNSFLEWYWGRFHFEDSTFVYYIMNKKSGDQFQAWHLDKMDLVLRLTIDLILSINH